MILIADSGSTQCTWLMADGDRVVRVRTQGINALLHTPAQIRATLSELPPCGVPDRVFFYGAGCGDGFPEATRTLTAELATRFGTERIEAASDLLGAARALFGGREGIACILGTGSNSGHYDGRRIVRNVPPLGYVLGDEGSGAALGRALLNGIFKGLIPLREELLGRTGLSYEEVLRRVYREPFANRFLASLAPFVRSHLECPEVRQTVAECFGEFVAHNLVHYPEGLEVSFVGGVAAAFEPLLRDVLNHYGLDAGMIAASPAEGLLKYHEGA